MKTTNMLQTNREKQVLYAKQLKEKHPGGLPLIHTFQFLDSIRNTPYKSTGTAIDEFIDNSGESGANRIFVFYTQNLEDIYIIDDGDGMCKDTLGSAVMWGGTHRANDLETIGRFGMGLPSAAFFLTEEYQVYSKTKETNWASINISLVDLKKKYENEKNPNIKEIIEKYDLKSDEGLEGFMKEYHAGVIFVPDVIDDTLPKEIQNYFKSQNMSFNSGTIIRIKNPKHFTKGTRSTTGLTRNYRRTTDFHKSLMFNLGITYRPSFKKKNNVSIFMYSHNEKKNIEVKSIDPLFQAKDALFYASRGVDEKGSPYTEDYDESLLDSKEGRKKLFQAGIIAKNCNVEPWSSVPVTNSSGQTGYIRLRFSLFSPRFGYLWDKREGVFKPPSKKSPRWRVMSSDNGTNNYCIITRNGRQIDTIKRDDFTNAKENMCKGTERPHHKYFAFEIDFDPVLDEFFGVTVDKQQIRIAEQIWDKLSNLKVPEHTRKIYEKAQDLFREKKEKEKREKKKKGEISNSERIAKTYMGMDLPRFSEFQKQKSKQYITNKIVALMEADKLTEEQAEENILKEIKRKPFVIERKNMGERSPVFHVEGTSAEHPGQRKVTLNLDHIFIKTFYMSSNPVFQLALDQFFLSYAIVMLSDVNSREDWVKREDDLEELSKYCRKPLKGLYEEKTNSNEFQEFDEEIN